MFEFEVQGEIVGKGRPRMNTKTKKIYTPTKTKAYEYVIRQYFCIKYPRFIVLNNRVKVTIISYFNIPKSTTKKNIKEMLEGNISPTKKPDIDNITKIVLDALNKFAFKDDTQVTKLIAEKRYSKEPRLYIKVEEY